MTVADIAEQLESALAVDVDAESYHLRQAVQLLDCEAGDRPQLVALDAQLRRALDREPGDRTPLLREAVGMLAEYRATGAISGADAAIPAPFDTIPVLEAPTPHERDLARKRYPPRAVPDDGPIPDPHHQVSVPVEVTVPPWVLASLRYRLQYAEPGLSDSRIGEWLYEYVYPDPEYVTPSGADAVALLAAHHRGDDSDDGDGETATLAGRDGDHA